MATQPRAEITRHALLDAAAECFALNGYDAVGVAEICRRANVTKGAFYHHFPTKQALFMVLLERWLSGLDAQLESVRLEAVSIPEGLQRMTERAEDLFVVASGQMPIFLEFWTKASRDPEVWQATIAPYRRYHAFLAGIMKAGIAEGSLRPVDPNSAAQVLLSLAVGLLLQGLLDPDGANWGEVARDSLGILMNGLRNKE